ncbi:hypothetical protein SH584_11450 [Sphingomonas sp. LY29]|uniref:portal protein n=1 Tax=Sphingomonas sp. LY29 TaxID=3095341 RepID=UPI002D76F39D|nr:hypothetical protein [Sphingomonas sp. LY29]WRP25647.1 hypothetical protein SH584_11450 [Sphingomonas sp. LY29]
MASPAKDFRDLVVKRRDSCVSYKDDKPSRDRREALRFYRGDNLADYGDSGDGLSTVVSRDVMEAVESVMPPLVRPFVAGEEVVSFEPIEKADLPSTEQANTYINHVFRRHNNVLDVAQTSLKDGLLFREGVAKTVMEECEEGGEEYDNLDQTDLMALLEENPDIVGPITLDEETGLHSVRLAPRKVKKYHVHIIAPEEFLREERLVSLKNATFLGHSKQMTLEDVIGLGIDVETAKGLNSGRPTSEETDDRFEEEDEQEWDSDDLARPVWVDECYIKCDPDNTGALEWRKVLLGGSQSKILSNEKTDGHPYSHWTPIPIPHKLTGLSYFDLTKDIQMNKTAVQRESNNALYLANRPMRAVLDGAVNLDDLLNPSVGGVVRVKDMGAIQALPSGGDIAFGAAAQMIEYWDSVREARTGVTRYNQGMDSNSLNKTATGMNIIASASQQRQELVARQFGEFLRDIFERLLKLVAQHADKADVERVTGKPFVPWPTSYDTNVSVGLGTNNKDQVVGHLMALTQMYERIITLQQGVEGPLVTTTNLYEVLKRLPEAMGLKGDFFTDPSQEEQAPAEPEGPPVDPEAETEIAKAQIKAESAAKVATIRGQFDLAKQAANNGFIDPNMGAAL